MNSTASIGHRPAEVGHRSLAGARFNTTERRTLDQWQPSPLAFDHAIAVVRLDGQIYWFDPTINYQRGPLSVRYPPDYERGLIILPEKRRPERHSHHQHRPESDQRE